MGTRMYISAPRAAELEFLGYGPEVDARLQAHRALSDKIQHETWAGKHGRDCSCVLCVDGNGDPGYTLYNRLAQDVEADRLYAYDLNGLGRLSHAAYDYAVEHGLCAEGDCSGGTSDYTHMRELIARQDISFLALLVSATSICWG
jgi:hypothetical protein